MTEGVSAPPVVSVVICTHNRATYLEKALGSVLAQLSDHGSTEVLVVDNGSTDRTPQVVRDAQARSSVRYLREDRLGLCHARNAGWRAARGSYVAYLDDDAMALPGWTETVRRVFHALPSVGVVGGPAMPRWEMDPPSWLSDHAARALALVDWPGGPKCIEDLDQEWLVGANMAVRRGVLEETGGFHRSLDRVGTNMLSNGDVHLQRQAIRLGYACYYDPGMAVRHVVPSERLDKRWFVRRYYWQGVSDAAMELVDDAPSPARRLLEAGRRAGRLVIRHPNQALALLRPTSHPESFTVKCCGWIEVGHIAGLLGAAKR